MRVKGGVKRRRSHKKVLKAVKGYRMSYHKTYKRAHEAFMHAGDYSFKHRQHRGADFRRLWITRIKAALLPKGVSYSRFIHALKENKIELNRKVLSEIAVNDTDSFNAVVEKVIK